MMMDPGSMWITEEFIYGHTKNEIDKQKIPQEFSCMVQQKNDSDNLILLYYNFIFQYIYPLDI